ncbi:hypothetical protein NW755_010731 [Fusarium falciforme]|uniref:Uncharacterized protein n=1 Tax=Fusarium falciforme TaxID=195108 RepID=A0A9W8QXZ3_9HYPO|nr:hypothetical protein NW755_010731 [Fusarium falciforme]
MIQRISREAGLDAFIRAIEQDGCVIIKDFADSESLNEAQREVQPYLDASKAAAGSTVGALNGGTAICTRLIGRSRTVKEKFFSDSLYQDIAEHFIGLETTCCGVHRQEEIPFLSYPIEEVKTYSQLVRDRLGWKQSEPNLGWVDLKSPEYLLE